jgi:hypothetical protein
MIAQNAVSDDDDDDDEEGALALLADGGGSFMEAGGSFVEHPSAGSFIEHDDPRDNEDEGNNTGDHEEQESFEEDGGEREGRFDHGPHL